jgi:urea transport system ATP-binding protein
MLNVRQLNCSYDETTILRNINLTIPAGKVIALMGRNGVGKTTLLKTVMGLLRPRAGEIFFDGQEITCWTPEKRARGGIGYVPQGRDIFPYLTVEENLLIGLEAHKAGRGMAIPEGIFDLFPALKNMLLRKGGNLSGGEQQQLAIARVLVSEPKLLLLDEPTEGIQPSIVLQIENTIRFIKEQGTISILLVEQYLEFALRLADYYYIMEKGSIVSEGITHDISKEVIANHLAV